MAEAGTLDEPLRTPPPPPPPPPPKALPLAEHLPRRDLIVTKPNVIQAYFPAAPRPAPPAGRERSASFSETAESSKRRKRLEKYAWSLQQLLQTLERQLYKERLRRTKMRQANDAELDRLMRCMQFEKASAQCAH
jgi:hypothetical protein